MPEAADTSAGPTRPLEGTQPFSWFNEFREHWVSVLLFVLTVLTIGFGFTGFDSQHRHHVDRGVVPTYDWTIPVYRTVQLLLLNSGTEEPDNFCLAVARMIAAATFLVLTFTVARQVFHDSTQLPARLTRTGHLVICGLGQIGSELLDDLRKQHRQRRLVIIERDETHPGLERARREGVDVVIGDAARPENLRRARAHCAEAVFVVTGDDGANLEIAAELDQLVARRPQVRWRRGKHIPLQLSVHLQDVKLAQAYQALSTTSPAAHLLELSVFSVARTSATHLVTRQLWPFAPRQRGEVAHFVVLGFGAMGRALTVTLARLGHFPNRKRSRFTIADHAVESRAREFLSRFSRFTAWNESSMGVSRFDAASDEWACQREAVPTALRSESPDAIDYVANAQFRELPPDLGDELFCRLLLTSFQDRDVTVKPVLFVCGQNDRENFYSAVRMRETLDRLGGSAVPIFVWIPRQPALARLLRQQQMLIPFGECHDSAGLEEVLNPRHEPLARAVHAHYEKLAVQTKQRSQALSWSETPEEFRESNRQFAEHFHIKLATLGWQLGHGAGQTATPFPPMDSATERVLSEMEHNRWVAERLMSGWCYAPPSTDKDTNVALRLHHDLVAWEKLGADRQIDRTLLNAILQEAQRQKYCLMPLLT